LDRDRLAERDLSRLDAAPEVGADYGVDMLSAPALAELARQVAAPVRERRSRQPEVTPNSLSRLVEWNSKIISTLT